MSRRPPSARDPQKAFLRSLPAIGRAIPGHLQSRAATPLPRPLPDRKTSGVIPFEYHYASATSSVAINAASTDFTVVTLTFTGTNNALYEIMATLPGVTSGQAANSYQITLLQGATTKDQRFVTPQTVGNNRMGHVLRNVMSGNGSSVTLTVVVREVATAGVHDGSAYAQSFAPIMLTARQVA